MIKKTVIWVCGLVLVAALPCPAFADQSIGFRHYFNEGVKAFKEHDDQKALRCFKIAQIYDPTDDELNRYLDILDKRGVTLGPHPANLSPQQSIGCRYYLKKGIEAFRKHDDKKAIHYFNIAIIFNPDSKEADRYLEILSRPSSVIAGARPAKGPALGGAKGGEAKPGYGGAISPTTCLNETNQPQPQPPLPSPQPQQPTTMPRQPAVKSPGVIYIAVPATKMPVAEISLAQISNNGQLNPRLQIELNSSVILDGKNIQRFLVVEENFIGVKILDPDRIKIDALKIGTTFIHIWDDSGRHTLYIEVIFPKSVTAGIIPEANGIRHAQPFIVTYANDWSAYYNGKNIPDLKRQSYDFNETLGLTGETPYGFFDASGSYTDFNSFSEFNTYTVGLSQIPLEGTSNFNLRGFDALRYLSPLTMPGTQLRGAFADVDLMQNILGLSVSHGQEQLPPGFIFMGQQTQFTNSYIDAAKLTLFPKSNTDRYSFNFATGYGQDRQPYLSDHVYSIEGHHKFNDFLTLNAEEATDSSHDATLASLKWNKGNFRTGLNFRNIDKDYATVSSLPANQGETGAVWTTDADFQRFTESTFVEAYRDRLYFNPDDPGALNVDANGHLRGNFTQVLWSDTDFNFVDTPGELSPQRSLGVNERLSRSFGVWNALKGTVFGGAGYQNSHSSGSNIFDYDREDAIAGIQVPLTDHISAFANYEYDWLNQPNSGGNSNPKVVNAGLEYSKQFTPKLSFNAQAVYRDELGVKDTTNFLSGEESVIITSGFAYNPTPDVSIFADGNASRIMSHIGNPSYDDLEFHLGVRISFGGTTYWDPLGMVSGVVFKDKNGDGKFNPGDEGIPGVKLRVGDKEVVTDQYGRYRVSIRAKGVEVVPQLDTIPAGLIFSTPQFLNVDIIQGRRARADFGLISQTGIYGIVFVDKNGSGVPVEGDKFIGKVKVVLDGKIIQRSDTHGAFYFRQVTPGTHTIAIDINTLALNMIPLVKLKNKIDVAEGVNYMFNIPVKIKKAESGEK